MELENRSVISEEEKEGWFCGIPCESSVSSFNESSESPFPGENPKTEGQIELRRRRGQINLLNPMPKRWSFPELRFCSSGMRTAYL
jgi:hypothetical protein